MEGFIEIKDSLIRVSEIDGVKKYVNTNLRIEGFKTISDIDTNIQVYFKSGSTMLINYKSDGELMLNDYNKIKEALEC